MHLTESRVQDALVPFLNKLGFRVVNLRGHGRTGVDIKARHQKYARYFEIEVKGEPGKGAKNRQSGRETRFLLGLGQILTRIRPERGYLYGVAYPSTYKPIVLRRVPSGVMKALRLSFLFVSPHGKVEQITWRDVSKNEATA